MSHESRETLKELIGNQNAVMQIKPNGHGNADNSIVTTMGLAVPAMEKLNEAGFRVIGIYGMESSIHIEVAEE